MKPVARSLRPRKRFGQHFLEPAWADKVVEVISPRPDDRFLEIGPGPGALPLRLAPLVQRLTAIEVDRELVARLRRQLPPHADVVEGDFLSIDLGPYVEEGAVRVAGNLPYNISSPILFKLLGASRHPGRIIDATIMLQLEVAERLTAEVGTADYGVLTIVSSLYAGVTRLLTLPPGAFRPVPRVRSAVVRLAFRPPPVPLRNTAQLERLVRTLFMQRRKTVLNALRPFAESLGRDARAALSAAAIDPGVRPEKLDLAALARLADVF